MQAFIEHPSVRAVTLTGSTRGRAAVAGAAGGGLKKTCWSWAAATRIWSSRTPTWSRPRSVRQARLINTGQSCIAAKRFIVVDGVRRGIRGRFVKGMAATKWRSPRGKMRWVRSRDIDLRDTLHEQVENAHRVAKGAPTAAPRGAHRRRGRVLGRPYRSLGHVREHGDGRGGSALPPIDSSSGSAAPCHHAAIVEAAVSAIAGATLIESGGVFINGHGCPQTRGCRSAASSGAATAASSRCLRHSSEFVNIKTVYVAG